MTSLMVGYSPMMSSSQKHGDAASKSRHGKPYVRGELSEDFKCYFQSSISSMNEWVCTPLASDRSTNCSLQSGGMENAENQSEDMGEQSTHTSPCTSAINDCNEDNKFKRPHPVSSSSNIQKPFVRYSCTFYRWTPRLNKSGNIVIIGKVKGVPQSVTTYPVRKQVNKHVVSCGDGVFHLKKLDPKGLPCYIAKMFSSGFPSNWLAHINIWICYVNEGKPKDFPWTGNVPDTRSELPKVIHKSFNLDSSIDFKLPIVLVKKLETTMSETASIQSTRSSANIGEREDSCSQLHNFLSNEEKGRKVEKRYTSSTQQTCDSSSLLSSYKTVKKRALTENVLDDSSSQMIDQRGTVNERHSDFGVKLSTQNQNKACSKCSIKRCVHNSRTNIDESSTLPSSVALLMSPVSPRCSKNKNNDQECVQDKTAKESNLSNKGTQTSLHVEESMHLSTPPTVKHQALSSSENRAVNCTSKSVITKSHDKHEDPNIRPSTQKSLQEKQETTRTPCGAPPSMNSNIPKQDAVRSRNRNKIQECVHSPVSQVVDQNEKACRTSRSKDSLLFSPLCDKAKKRTVAITELDLGVSSQKRHAVEERNHCVKDWPTNKENLIYNKGTQSSTLVEEDIQLPTPTTVEDQALSCSENHGASRTSKSVPTKSHETHEHQECFPNLRSSAQKSLQEKQETTRTPRGATPSLNSKFPRTGLNSFSSRKRNCSNWTQDKSITLKSSDKSKEICEDSISKYDLRNRNEIKVGKNKPEMPESVLPILCLKKKSINDKTPENVNSRPNDMKGELYMPRLRSRAKSMNESNIPPQKFIENDMFESVQDCNKSLKSDTMESHHSQNEALNSTNILVKWMPVLACPIRSHLVLCGYIRGKDGILRKVRTKPIRKRLQKSRICTLDGFIYKLDGPPENPKKDIPNNIFSRFSDGIPEDWEQLLIQWKKEYFDVSSSSLHSTSESYCNHLLTQSRDMLSGVNTRRGRSIVPPLRYWLGERVMNNGDVSVLQTSASFISTQADSSSKEKQLAAANVEEVQESSGRKQNKIKKKQPMKSSSKSRSIKAKQNKSNSSSRVRRGLTNIMDEEGEREATTSVNRRNKGTVNERTWPKSAPTETKTSRQQEFQIARPSTMKQRMKMQEQLLALHSEITTNSDLFDDPQSNHLCNNFTVDAEALDYNKMLDNGAEKAVMNGAITPPAKYVTDVINSCDLESSTGISVPERMQHESKVVQSYIHRQLKKNPPKKKMPSTDLMISVKYAGETELEDSFDASVISQKVQRTRNGWHIGYGSESDSECSEDFSADVDDP